jgi:hypothetical protein
VRGGETDDGNQSNSTSSPKSSTQEVFEREAREKLKNADMDAFGRMMKRVIQAPKDETGKKGG